MVVHIFRMSAIINLMKTAFFIAMIFAFAPFYASAGTAELEYAEVIKVIDGDTIQISDGEKVRYIGIDTPELNGQKYGRIEKPECYAREALLKNHEFVYGKTVGLQRDKTDRDKYGRLLRYVYIDDVRINDELVRSGHAKAFIFGDDRKYAEEIIAAEAEAKEGTVGMWSECGDREKKEATENMWSKLVARLKKFRNLFGEILNSNGRSNN